MQEKSMIETKLNALYEKYGYRKFKMSKFEPYDLYADNRDFLKSSQLITFTDLDGSLLALKPDVTLSIVKANAGGEEKVYYNETVYRPKDDHYKEILQAGVERIGRIDSFSEAEIIALAAKSMALVSENFVIRISDAAFLRELFSFMQLSDSTMEEVLRLFSMKNSAGLAALTGSGRLTEAGADSLRELAEMYLPFAEGVEKLRKFAISNTSMQMVEHLKELSCILEAFGVLDSVFLDFSLVNSMDYYNGIIFQGAGADIPFTVLSGGRYDRLPEKMGRKVGAIGFAMYLDTIENYLPAVKKNDADYLIVYEETTPAAELAEVVERLVRSGARVRTVRTDEVDRMERRIRAARMVTFREAVLLPDTGADSGHLPAQTEDKPCGGEAVAGKERTDD